jgi:hypothetical protein
MCGIVGNNLCGLHFIGVCVTAASYRHVLENELQLNLKNVPLHTRRQMLIKHDGVCLHFSSYNTGFLNANDQGMWIGHSGPVVLPARLPDLNMLDIFYGKPETSQQLLELIKEGIGTIKTNKT